MKKITIFLSSTFEELKEHREKIIHGLQKLKQTVDSMEYWCPSANTPIEKSLKKVRSSKIFVGVLGTRYGYTLNDGISITHHEYLAAVESGIERQMYIIDEKKHPIQFSNVDTGEKASKLKNFKEEVNKEIRDTFVSPDDLAQKVITNVIQLLQEEGEDIRTAINGQGIKNFQIRSGYSLGFIEQKLDISPFIEMNESGKFSINDKYIESVTAAGIISKNISEGNFDFLDGYVTFEPDVIENSITLAKHQGVDKISLKKSITNTFDPHKLRLLIYLAGRLKVSECAEIICEKVLSVREFQNEISRYDMPITPYKDIVKDALSEFDTSSTFNIIERYRNIAKNKQEWQAKQIFEKAIKNLNN